MGINSWIFLKDCKPTFLHPPPSQNGWLIEVIAVQHVWRAVNDAGFTWLHTRNLNEDPPEYTSGDIRSYYGFNNNPAMGQFVDALKTNITNGCTNRGLCVTNCEDEGATLLDNLQLLLRALDFASLNLSTTHG
jgi:hypothetical protein